MNEPAVNYTDAKLRPFWAAILEDKHGDRTWVHCDDESDALANAIENAHEVGRKTAMAVLFQRMTLGELVRLRVSGDEIVTNIHENSDDIEWFDNFEGDPIGTDLAEVADELIDAALRFLGKQLSMPTASLRVLHTTVEEVTP